MRNYLKIKSPSANQARALASSFGLSNHGIKNLGTIYWNLSTPALYEEIIFRNEGNLVNQGPVLVKTGKHTGNATKTMRRQMDMLRERGKDVPVAYVVKIMRRTPNHIKRKDAICQPDRKQHV